MLIQQGNFIRLQGRGDFHETLPKGTYLVSVDENGIYFLEQILDYKLPEKVYGDFTFADKVIKYWKESKKETNMGCQLSGLKGTGKTITAKYICLNSGMPVIVMNSNHFANSSFMNFITNSAFKGCIFFIDEFEKIMSDMDDQTLSRVLSFFDGIYDTKFLILLTCNQENVSEFLENRLSRIKYHKRYYSMTTEEMQPVINDLLKDKTFEQSIYQFFEKINICTMDLLVSLIEEINFFNQDAFEVGKDLNISVEDVYYEVALEINEENLGEAHGIYGHILEDYSNFNDPKEVPEGVYSSYNTQLYPDISDSLKDVLEQNVELEDKKKVHIPKLSFISMNFVQLSKKGLYSKYRANVTNTVINCIDCNEKVATYLKEKMKIEVVLKKRKRVRSYVF